MSIQINTVPTNEIYQILRTLELVYKLHQGSQDKDPDLEEVQKDLNEAFPKEDLVLDKGEGFCVVCYNGKVEFKRRVEVYRSKKREVPYLGFVYV